jgi:hypothetical protein
MFRVTGKMTRYHTCGCGYCQVPTKQSVDVSRVVPGPVEYDEFADREGIEDAALNEQYRAMGLLDATDSLAWDRSEEIKIRKASPDEVMVTIGTPRLPGFEEV